MSEGAPRDYDGKPFRAAHKDPPLQRVLPVAATFAATGRARPGAI